MSKTITKNRRVNVSLQDDLAQKLSFFSERENKPLASKALEYIKKGLEEDEDLYWTKLAEERMDEFKNSDQKTLTFNEIWGKNIPSDSCPS